MECEMCGGLMGLLGTLGNLVHLNCRDCGIQHSMPNEDFREMMSFLAEDAECNPPLAYQLDYLTE